MNLLPLPNIPSSSRRLRNRMSEFHFLSSTAAKMLVFKVSYSDFCTLISFRLGWGKVRHPGNGYHILQQAKMPVVSNEVCHRKNFPRIRIPVSIILYPWFEYLWRGLCSKIWLFPLGKYYVSLRYDCLYFDGNWSINDVIKEVKGFILQKVYKHSILQTKHNRLNAEFSKFNLFSCLG